MGETVIETLAVERMSGAGNRFVVHDAMGGSPASIDQLGSHAVELCRHHDVDGLLILAPPAGDGDARMVVFNADGSRPEACGNGLRCLTALARRRGHVQHDRFVMETDAGPRWVEVHRRGTEIDAATIELGVPEVDEPEVVELRGTQLQGRRIGLGNPHLVVFVEDVDRAPLEEWGQALQTHAAFPEGVNLEVCEAEGPLLRMRVFERGVGETASCGTGACASAVAAVLAGKAHSPLRVAMPGGVLQVRWSGTGSAHLRGPVEFGGES